MAKMSIIVRKQDKNSISCFLVVEQPQSLLDNGYNILPKEILGKAKALPLLLVTILK